MSASLQNKSGDAVLDNPTPAPVISWLDQNFGTIVTIALAVVAFIAWLVRLEYKVGDLTKDLNKVSDCVDEHTAETQIHIDPVRDERRWQEMRESQNKMQAKLDRVLEVLNRYQ
jgi:uncharacterized membrane protein YccC